MPIAQTFESRPAEQESARFDMRCWIYVCARGAGDALAAKSPSHKDRPIAIAQRVSLPIVLLVVAVLVN